MPRPTPVLSPPLLTTKMSPSETATSPGPRTPTRPFTYEVDTLSESQSNTAGASSPLANEAIRLGEPLERHTHFDKHSATSNNTTTTTNDHERITSPISESDDDIVVAAPTRGPYTLLTNTNEDTAMNTRRVSAIQTQLTSSTNIAVDDGHDVPLTPMYSRKSLQYNRTIDRPYDIQEEENEDDDDDDDDAEEDGDAWLRVKWNKSRQRGASFSTILLEDVAGRIKRKLSFGRSDMNVLDEDPLNESGHTTEESPLVVVLQTLPSLMISVMGLMLAGWLLDVVQHWTVFTQVTQLFIMVPVLLGLKGNLEMNLASRMSTAANLGDLDSPRSQRLLVWGNLALLQLQALSVSCLAGLLSVIMGLLTSGGDRTFSYHRGMLVVTSAMICAALSSALLGLCMCILCIFCRRRGINPDNVATPIAASFGDLITLAVLAVTSHLLYPMRDTLLPTILFVIMLSSLPAWFWLIRKNELVRETMFDGWVPILLAMAISSLAGLVLERYIDRYAGMAVLVPVLNGVSGNLCCVFASRISTSLHARRSEKYWTIGIVLWLLNLPVQWPFLGIVRAFHMGHGSITIGMFLLYTLASMLLVAGLLVASRWIVFALWRRSLDPDNYALPYITAIGDVAGTSSLVLVFLILYGNKPSTMT